MKNNQQPPAQCNERDYITRYAGSGLINTIVGFIVIFCAMSLGFSPVISNIAGYVVGFMLGFFLSKKFVFRSEGHFVAESIRYLFAFVFAFLINLIVLQTALNYLKDAANLLFITNQLKLFEFTNGKYYSYLLNSDSFNAFIAQVAAAISYTVNMYALTRFFVFDTRKIST